MTTRVSIGDRAEAQIVQIDRWWKANRPAAPDLFHHEVLGCLGLLRATPEIGHPERHRRIPGLRRVLLAASRYHVYYAYDSVDDVALVLAAWSALRGRRPPLSLLPER
ncbi:MAG: type II toxin-antitoxin system RelE/ParE family toxin [Candidatus Riflebacteria bacterium]|nr:type II toxin-antitoxin system RelE/ParE family toxin [Candidatus Riflebacteria bacterium]